MPRRKATSADSWAARASDAIGLPQRNYVHGPLIMWSKTPTGFVPWLLDRKEAKSLAKYYAGEPKSQSQTKNPKTTACALLVSDKDSAGTMPLSSLLGEMQTAGHQLTSVSIIKVAGSADGSVGTSFGLFFCAANKLESLCF